MQSFYKNILNLRNETDDVVRGVKFEQFVREIQPWDRKPAITISVPTEQLDGIFVWKDKPYLIESKAKKDVITAGSHDWEDFELKIRRRKNAVTGLFCSLFAVNAEVYKRADTLINEGFFVLVFAGSFWDQLLDFPLPFKDLLEYMNFFGRIKFIAQPPNLKIVNDWIFDKVAIENKIADLCKKNSSTFLRRYISPLHYTLYIARDIDGQILSYAQELKPSSLKKTKERPKQLCLVRDYSGSGKTTLSLNLALGSDFYFATSIAANEPDIDTKFFNFFSSLGDAFGLQELIATNKSIVFIVDSLDEAHYDIHKKRREIKAIFRFIDEELNKAAEDMELSLFPLLLIFTIREDYWRNWESEFEGRKSNSINKRISSFLSYELPVAIEKYSNSYHYKIISPLSEDSKKVLSIPINLLIFSEANNYSGDITTNEIWEGNVIDSYFFRKKNDINNRHVVGLTSKVFIDLISFFAFFIVKEKNYNLSKAQINALVGSYYMVLYPYLDEVLQAIVSEQILNRDSVNTDQYNFRHSRFIEYLLAYYIVNNIQEKGELNQLDYFAEISFASGIVQMFRVHDDIRHIGKKNFPRVVNSIDEYYSKSTYFMSKKLLRIRSDLATNVGTSQEDMGLILKNTNRNDNEDVIMNAYFVIVAKCNEQSKQTVLDFFLLAFGKCTNLAERYKLIAKLEQHDLLINDSVLSCLYSSYIAKEWEVYLGMIVNTELISDFQDLWHQTDGNRSYENIILTSDNEDWGQASKLLDDILLNRKHILGE